MKKLLLLLLFLGYQVCLLSQSEPSPIKPILDKTNNNPNSDEGTVFVPNTFSPNDDGNNDVLSPFGKDIEIEAFMILNHWGNIIYKEETTEPAWNGKEKGLLSLQGTYVWALRYRDLKTGETKVKMGEVLLVR